MNSFCLFFLTQGNEMFSFPSVFWRLDFKRCLPLRLCVAWLQFWVQSPSTFISLLLVQPEIYVFRNLPLRISKLQVDRSGFQNWLVIISCFLARWSVHSFFLAGPQCAFYFLIKVKFQFWSFLNMTS